MSCEEANIDVAEDITVEIGWSRAEMLVARVIVFVSNIKARICG